MKPIINVPNKILNSSTKRVVNFDKKLSNLISDMKQALLAAKNPKGVGLAAPQIGEPWKVFVTKPASKDPIRVFINPEIVNQSAQNTSLKDEEKLEGCLSVPKIWGEVKRASEITIKFQNEKGTWLTESFTGFMSIIIQHEMDHLNGTLFTHRVLEQSGKMYQTIKDARGKEALEEITI